MALLDATAISRPRPPDFIPGYRLERLVGRGGMGEVYRAVQLSLGRTVAVKILASELAKDESFVARFDKEGAALAALSHPNIVSIVDKGKAESTYYLVMEFIDGPSMREVMRSPLLDAGTSLRMVYEVCRAIDYAHNRGIIHRDLKPENILFDEQAGGIAKVSDFGLAGFAGPFADPSRLNITQTHVAMGTLAYMAPEQHVDARSVDHRADIYSLGVILYELLVGELPAGSFAPPSQRKPELDKRLDGIVARCLKPLAQERYQKVSDLLEELEPHVPVGPSGLLLGKRRAVRAWDVTRRVLEQTLRVGGIAVVLAAVGVLGIAALRAGPKAALAPAGDLLTTDFGAKWPLTAPGRVEQNELGRSVSLGEGPDVVPVVALGRKPDLSDGKVAFGAAAPEALAGRAVLDVRLDGDRTLRRLTFQAQAELLAPPKGPRTTLRNYFKGEPPEPRAALLLLGKNDRYVALIASGSGGAPVLEWSLGERRGSMSSPAFLSESSIKLELVIDPQKEELGAYVGEGADRRLVGDLLGLGPDWQRAFGEVPQAAMGCLAADCTFGKVRVETEFEPPPPPPAPPPPLVLAPQRVLPAHKAPVRKPAAKFQTTSGKKTSLKKR